MKTDIVKELRALAVVVHRAHSARIHKAAREIIQLRERVAYLEMIKTGFVEEGVK